MNGDVCPDLNQVCIERTVALRAELARFKGWYLTARGYADKAEAERDKWQAEAYKVAGQYLDERGLHTKTWKRADAAEARLAAVEALHQPFTPGRRVGDNKDVGTLCDHCTDTGDPYCVVSEEWPCPTIKAARGAPS